MRPICDEGAFVNAASSEEGTRQPGTRRPARHAGRRDGGDYRLTGEKTFTTWLPALRFALVSARLVDEARPAARDDRRRRSSATCSSTSNLPGVERLAGFDALGMRASASGRLGSPTFRFRPDMLVARRAGPASPDPRGRVGAGLVRDRASPPPTSASARAPGSEVIRWAVDRRPGDGSTAVADIPTVQVRLGRLDAALRAARIVLLDVARRWDAARPDAAAGLLSGRPAREGARANAAVDATDEALRIAGGPGFLAGPLERAFRDARAGLINPPLDDVAYQAFAQALVGGPAAADVGPPVASPSAAWHRADVHRNGGIRPCRRSTS